MRKSIEVPPLTEVPSEDVKARLDEYGTRLNILEAFGAQLTYEDYFDRGVDYYYKGQFELALEAFNRAIILRPASANAWISKGITLGELDHHEDELEAYDKAIEIDPGYARAWYNRACLYATKAQKEKVLSDLRTAVGLVASYKEDAKKDEDFKDCWNDVEFIRIVR